MSDPSSSKPKAKKSSASTAKARSAASAGTQGSPNRTTWIIGGVVVILGIALLAAVMSTKKSKTEDAKKVPTGSSAAAVVKTVTSIPVATSNKVGAGSVKSYPRALDGAALTKDGKPEVLYIGAEYCPFCAAQRWAITNALSRFGTFDKLKLSRSSAIDTFPNTPTFSFYGSTYDSKYVTFTPVETETNEPAGTGGYKPLQSLTAEQAQLLQTLGNNGSIPFLNVGGKYVIGGATYEPDVLQGKTHAEVADAMADPTTDVSKGALGSANLLTALICQTTDGKPGDVCNASAIKAITKQLG